MKRYAGITIIAVLLAGLANAQVKRPVAGANKIDETTKVINDCEKRTNTFKRSVKLKVKGDAPNLQRDADQLEEALNKVGDSWNRDHDPQKTRAFVTAAITVGQQINRYMTTFRGDGDLTNQWTAVRAELNRLAQTFALPAIRW
jgi:hypothetical protein